MLQRVDTETLNARINVFILAEQDTALKKKTQAGEYSGPCPFCGGTDRFSVKDNKWLCRTCTDGKWNDGIEYAMRRGNESFVDVAKRYLGNDAPKFDPQVAAQREANREAERERMEKDLARRLADFTTSELCQETNRRMAEDNRAWWRLQGIPDNWQNYLELGYMPEKHYKVGDTDFVSPAYTIPYYHSTSTGKMLSTMQYRLMNPKNPADRYRFEFGLPSTFYETTPTKSISDLVVICEGAKKGAVLKIHGGVNDKTTVLAVPGKASWGGVVEAVKDCGRVYVVLDPDGREQADKLARKIGSAARIVNLHVKIDDGILSLGLDKAALHSAFRNATRVQ